MKKVRVQFAVSVAMALLLIFAFIGGVASADNFNVSVIPLHFVINNIDKTPANNMFFNGQTNVPAGFILNGTTYVPLRFLSEALGASVTWDASTHTIVVDTAGIGTSSGSKPLEELRLWNSPNLSLQGPWQTDPSAGSIYLKKQATSGNTYSISYNLNQMASEVKATLYLDMPNTQMSAFGDYVTYNITGDTKQLYTDNIVTSYVGPVNIDVPVNGVSTLTIQVQIGPSSNVGFATTGVQNLRALTRQY